MARLVFEDGDKRGESYLIAGDCVRIGRSSSNDLQVPDQLCSRHHAELHRDAAGYLVRDLGSKNALYVNEQLVEGDRRLMIGDRIRIGDTTLRFEDDAEFDDPLSADTASQTVRVVDDKDSHWGQLRVAVAAGRAAIVQTPLETARGEALREPLRRLEVLYEVADKIRSILDLDLLLQQIVEILTKVLRPDIVTVLLHNEETGALEPQATRTRTGAVEEVAISRSIVDLCLTRRSSVLFSDDDESPRLPFSESIVAHRIHSAICSPLIHQDQPLGVIYIDSKSAALPYQREEVALVTGIVNQAAMAIANARMHAQLIRQQRLEREMEIAHAIQTNLLPRRAPDLPGFEIWGMSQPAKQVGGDYFDYIARSAQELGLAVADVSGKGVPAAILAAIVRASLQIFAGVADSDVRGIMTQLNHAIHRDATSSMFVSAVFGILDAARRTLVYSNAGHCHPLLFLPDGELKQLDVGGYPLGIEEGLIYEVTTVGLPPGATLFIYTDGVTDMVNAAGESFDEARVIPCVRGLLDRSARGICEGVFEAIHGFAGAAEQFDDCTAVAIKSL